MSHTIIISFGARGQLRGQLDRARRYGTPITVVPAIPLATRGLRTHRSGLVAIAEEPGRKGLASVLAGLPDDEPVLLLHEDVLLHEEGAQRLLDTASWMPGIIVPSTNHPDADGYVGALPPDVVQPVREGELVRGEVCRTSCMAATVAMLRRRIDHRLTAAGTRLHIPDGSIHVDEGVVATHLDVCVDQLEDPVGPDGRPLLVASMIVRDEEDFLADCLASLEGLVDRIDICDTGSTDRTVEIAEAHGAQVIHREWRDDFAWARNQALDLSRDAWWVLQIDADERAQVDDPEAFRRFLATALPDRGAFDIPVHDIDEDGSDKGSQQLPRLFTTEDTTYLGRLHEVAHRTDGTPLRWSVTNMMRLVHLGYQASVIHARDKRQRNLELARRAHEEEGNLETAINLARSLPRNDEGREEAITLLRGVLEEIEKGTKHLAEGGMVITYQVLATALGDLGRMDEAWEVASAGRQRFPASPDLRTLAGRIGVATGHFEDVVASADDVDRVQARPVHDPALAATHALDVAESLLATEEVERAGEHVTQLVAAGIPASFGRWSELVSVIAISCGDDAVQVLLDAVRQDRTGTGLREAIALLEGDDRATFAAEAVRGGDATPQQLEIAFSVALDAGSVEALDTIVQVAPGFADEAHVRRAAMSGAPELVTWAAAQLGVELPAFDIDEALGRLAEGDVGDVDQELLAEYVASDISGTAMRRLTSEVPPAVAAPLAAAAIARGIGDRSQLTAGLAAITIAGDGAAARTAGPHLEPVEDDVLDRLLTRAAGRGASEVAQAIAEVLVGRTPIADQPMS